MLDRTNLVPYDRSMIFISEPTRWRSVSEWGQPPVGDNVFVRNSGDHARMWTLHEIKKYSAGPLGDAMEWFVGSAPVGYDRKPKPASGTITVGTAEKASLGWWSPRCDKVNPGPMCFFSSISRNTESEAVTALANHLKDSHGVKAFDLDRNTPGAIKVIEVLP